MLGFFLRNPLLIALIVVAGWGTIGRLEGAGARKARDQALTTLDAERSAHRLALADARAAAATEKARILAAQKEALDDADRRSKRAQAAREQAAVALVDAQRLLHDAIAARIGSGAAPDDPAAARERAAAASFGALLDACAAEHQRLASDADTAVDTARGAGQSCERAYDALTPPPTRP